jgi:chromosome segregation ATPase
MPRGVKKQKNYEEEIALIEEKIASHESKIKTLRLQLESLRKEREQKNLQELNRLINQSGMSIDDISKMISKPNNVTV